MTPFRIVVRNLEEILAGTLMVLMAIATLLNVIGRYFLNSPIPWAEEFSRYAFIWLVFIGAVVCTKRGRHICIDLVVLNLPKKVQPFVVFVANAATVVLMLILIYYGTILAASATQPTSTLNIPTYIVYMVVPLSAVLILFYTIRDMLRVVRGEFGAGATP